MRLLNMPTRFGRRVSRQLNPCVRIDPLEAKLLLSAVVSEFQVPSATAAPLGITAASDGAIWFTESTPLGSKIGEFNPSTATFTEYPLPTAQGTPEGITVGPGGNIWFTEFGAQEDLLSPGAPSQIGELNIATGQITEFPVDDPTAGPTAIVAALNGTLYFTESSANEIGMIDASTSTPTFSYFDLNGHGTDPTGITVGSDGNVWYTADAVIGSFNPLTKKLIDFPIPTANSVPQSIASGPGLGPDGDLWFTESATNIVARVSPVSFTTVDAITVPGDATYTLPSGGGTFGPGTVIPANTTLPAGTFAEYTVPIGAEVPYGITHTAGDGKDVMFTLYKSNQIGSIDAATGNIKLTRASGGPTGIVESGGATWFAEQNSDRLGVRQLTAPWYSYALLNPPDTADGQGAFRLTVTNRAHVTPTGLVVFTLDGAAQPPVALNSHGVASFTPKNLSAGTHVVSAAYPGDANDLPSTSNTTYTIVISKSENQTDATIDTLIAAAMRDNEIPGLSLAIVRPGQPSIIRSYGLADVATGKTVGTDTPFELASVTKTYTSVGVLLLAQDPSLVTKPLAVPFNINRPIVNYLSADPANDFTLPASWDDITAAELMAMSSGIIKLGTSFLTWQQILQHAASQPLAGPPGTGYVYSDPAFILLGELIQQLSGESYSTFIGKEILDPLGLSNTVVRSGNSVPADQATGYQSFNANSGSWLFPPAYRPASASFSAGAISTTGVDMASYLSGLLEQRILTPASYATMYTPIPLIEFDEPHDKVVRGLGWDSVNENVRPDPPLIAKNGALPGFTAEYVLWPNQNLAIGVMTNTGLPDIVGLVKSIYAAIHPAPATTTTALAASATSISVGDSVNITARVKTASGIVPTGHVIFAVDGVSQPPIALNASGGVAQAVLRLTGLTQGVHVITARYSGSAADSGSTAVALGVFVKAADGPRVKSVVRQGALRQPTRLVIAFDAPLDATSAANATSYTLTRVTLRGAPRSIAIASVGYNAAQKTVTLQTGPRLPLFGLYRLVVRGTGPSPIRNSAGLALDGQATGQPGSDYSAVITLANLLPSAGTPEASREHPKFSARPRRPLPDVDKPAKRS